MLSFIRTSIAQVTRSLHEVEAKTGIKELRNKVSDMSTRWDSTFVTLKNED